MFKQFLAVAVMAVSAQAGAVTIDFEGIPEGTAPGNYYADLGVTFTGGVVRYNHLGAYVASPVTVNFSRPVNNLSFGADGLTIDTNSIVCYFGGTQCDPQYLGSVSWMPTPQTNFKREDWYPGQTWLTSWRFPDITSVRFVTEALTDLSFTMQDATLPASGVATGEVPLPGTAWLLGAGMLALLGRSRSLAKPR